MSSACVLHAFLARSGPYLGRRLSVCAQLLSCMPVWFSLTLIVTVSSTCVLSLCSACHCGSLWPLFGQCPQPVSSARVLCAFLARSGPYLGCRLKCVCSACVLYAFLGRSHPDCDCVINLSACVLHAFVGRSGPYLGSVLSLCPQLASCVPFWLALALIWAAASVCVLSLCPACLSGLHTPCL